jgi:protein gp37
MPSKQPLPDLFSNLTAPPTSSGSPTSTTAGKPPTRPINLSAIPRSIAAEMTDITWTSFSLNAWAGCTPIPGTANAPSGCDICYARTYAERKWPARWGTGQPRHLFKDWRQRARRLDKMAAESALRFSVFALSLGDWLDPEILPIWREDLIAVIEETHHLDWLLLTHRPQLARQVLPSSWIANLPPHVWPGATLDHAAYAHRWHSLLDTWGTTGRCWVSAEPLATSLAAVDLSAASVVIVGGASNTTSPTWHLPTDIVTELLNAYPGHVHFKQWGTVAGPTTNRILTDRSVNDTLYDWTPWPRHRDILTARATDQRRATICP